MALLTFGGAIPLLFAALVWRIAAAAVPAIETFRWGFLTGTTWAPASGRFGAVPLVWGTLASSLLALLLAVPLSLGLAVFATELAPRWLATLVVRTTELLAAIPGVIYGLWATYALVPWLREAVQRPISARFGDTFPVFAGPAYGFGILAAAVVLAIMILPFVSTVAREVLAAVPRAQREAALALGATRWEATWQVVLPFAAPGIVGAVILGLGRALGETMAVTMVVGNRPELAVSLFAPASTLTSVLVNEFAEASGGIYVAALMELALLLFGITIAVNVLARLLVRRVARSVPPLT